MKEIIKGYFNMDKKILVTGSTGPISDKISSHKAAEGWVYYDMIKHSRRTDAQVDIDSTKSRKNFDDYSLIILYHGNDFQGSLNIFGGLKNLDLAEHFYKLGEFKGELASIKIKMPDYGSMIKGRLSGKTGYDKIWDNIKWDNITNSRLRFDPRCNEKNSDLVIGDSHSISLYDTGKSINCVPFKTLNGALSDGLESFIKIYEPNEFSSISFYFGNIDIRHHLFRLSDGLEDALIKTELLVKKYLKEVSKIDNNKKIIYAPLPIESESRVVPKSGWHKGKPFWGSWEERNKIRKHFIECLFKYNQYDDIIIENTWCDYLLNKRGELDFRFMEKPRSVHLSREFYPYWQTVESKDELFGGLF